VPGDQSNSTFPARTFPQICSVATGEATAAGVVAVGWVTVAGAEDVAAHAEEMTAETATAVTSPRTRTTIGRRVRSNGSLGASSGVEASIRTETLPALSDSSLRREGSRQHMATRVDTGQHTTKITVHPRSKMGERSTTADRRLDRKPLT
jgi:hypothetical protein